MSYVPYDRGNAVIARKVRARVQVARYLADWHLSDAPEEENQDRDRIDIVCLIMVAVLAALVFMPTLEALARNLY